MNLLQGKTKKTGINNYLITLTKNQKNEKCTTKM